jgi:photosystem II stability/assembly factor-like uncharacterized protein
MKKYITFFLIIAGLIVVIHRQRNTDHTEMFQDEKTPRQLMSEELIRKGQRRDQGHFKRFDQPEEYIAYHRMIRTAEGEDEPGYLFGYRQENLMAAKSAPVKQLHKLDAVWKERGPANVPGRTRGLFIDPDDPAESTWLAGSVGGGIWRTTDKGLSWENLTPHLPNLATTSLAYSPSDPDIIYAGTGEGWYGTGMIDGDGIFKSTDRGNTWEQLPFTAANDDFQNVNRIIVDPDNPDILLVCSNTGHRTNVFNSVIMHSADGGLSWNKVFEYNNRIQDLIFHPDDFNIQYAAIFGTGVYKSTDAGQSWFPAREGMRPDGRVEIAIAPGNPDVIYASCEGAFSGSYSDLYRTTNAGQSWSLIVPGEGERIYEFLGGQGWFNNTIAVHPFDENAVYFGGVNLFRATVGEETGVRTGFLGADYLNFLELIYLVNFGASHAGGTIDLSDELPEEDFVSVELRFGPGIGQKAHRFTVNKQGAGVPPSGYIYRDYVDVPFEIWDIDNNRQLMVSFRDQEEDGVYDLRYFVSDNPGREYIFMHAIPYSDEAHPEIAKNAGHVFRNMYMVWPTLADGAQWTPDNLPEAVLRLNFGQMPVRYGAIEHISDAYNQYSGLNSYTGTGFHPDHHNLILTVTDPADQTFWVLNANDGGVFYTEPHTEPGARSGDWIFAGHGFNTTQFYGADKRPEKDEYIGGSQDNGTWRSPAGEVADEESDYIFQISGDGFETVWHHEDPLKLVGGAQFNLFRYTTNGGDTWRLGTTGLLDRGGPTVAPFVSRLANSKHDPDILYAVGSQGVWRSSNFAATWNSRAMGQYWNFSSSSNVEVSLSDYSIIWAGGSMSTAGRLHVSTNYGESFQPVNNYADVTMGSISGLATHPTEDSTAYVMFSFAGRPKVLRTEDLGQTWEDISGFGSQSKSNNGFPDVAVYCLLVMPHKPDIIWVGTEIGLVESHDRGESWHLYQDGLPSVSVWNMKVVDDQVVVATHGRGIWTAEIADLQLRPFVRKLVQHNAEDKMLLMADFHAAYDSVQVYLNRQYQHTMMSPFRGRNIVNLEIKNLGIQKAYLVGFVNGQAYQSAKSRLHISEVTSTGHDLPAVSSMKLYPNPARSSFFIELPEVTSQEMTVSILDNSGRVVYRETRINNGVNHFFTGRLPQGIYHISVVHGKESFSERLVIVN